MIELILVAVISVAGIFAYRRYVVSIKRKEIREKLPPENHLFYKNEVGFSSSSYYLTQIDDNVLEAMEDVYVTDLSSFKELHDYINDKYLDVLLESSAEDWMTRFQELVVEQDGFPDHEHIFGYEELQPEIIRSVMEESFEDINTMHKKTGVGIPIAAIAVSGFREFNLLIEEKTERIRSIQNVVLDFAGTSGGGFAGARVGAKIGSFAGPIGSAIGGILGAIGGAKGGRTFSNYFKFKHFRAAVDQYEAQIDICKNNIKQKQYEGKNGIEKAIVDINQKANEEKASIEAEYRNRLDEFRKDYIQQQKHLCLEAPKILDAIKATLKQNEQEVVQNDILYHEHKLWFERKYKLIDDTKQIFAIQPEDAEQIKKRYAEVKRFFQQYPSIDEDLLAILKQLADQDIENHSKWAKENMYAIIIKAESKVREDAVNVFESISMLIHEQTRHMQEKVNEVKVEARKLGKEF